MQEENLKKANEINWEIRELDSFIFTFRESGKMAFKTRSYPNSEKEIILSATVKQKFKAILEERLKELRQQMKDL